jgi:hypothetical protein
VGRKFK